MKDHGASGGRIRGVRDVHAITGCIFLCTLTCYFERMGFSIAFTELAAKESLDEGVKGTVLSAFFWGYAMMQVPGGWLAARHGGARVLALSFALWGVISLCTPGTVHDSNMVFITICRVAVGASQGLFIPASHTLLAQWIPPHERSRLVTLAMSGMYLGSGVAMLVVPYVVEYFGPKAQFATSGLLALAWLAMWSRVGSDHPSTEAANHGDIAHPPLLQDEEDGSGWEEVGVVERQLSSKKDDPGPLKLARGGSGTIGGKPNARGSQSASPQSRDVKDLAIAGVAGGAGSRSSRIPWGVLVKSPAVWAILTSNFAFHYATYVLMSWLPTYFQRHIGVGLYDMGNWYKVMPYVMMFLASNVGGSLGTYLHVSRGKSIVFSRKFVNTLGFSLAGVSLLLMPRATNWRDGLLYTTLALSSLGLCRGGWAVNHMDIAPRHAGVVMAIANGAGTLAGVVGVSWTGAMLMKNGGPGVDVAWSIALGVVSFICGTALIVFLALAEGEVLFH